MALQNISKGERDEREGKSKNLILLAFFQEKIWFNNIIQNMLQQ